MANNKGNTKPNLTYYSSPTSARATSYSACKCNKCSVARDTSCIGKRDLPNQGNSPCLDNHGTHQHLNTSDSSNPDNPPHTDSQDSSNPLNRSNTNNQDSSNPLNPSNTDSQDSSNPLNPSNTVSQDSSNSLNPSNTDNQNSSNPFNPSNTDSQDSSNPHNPSNTDSQDSPNPLNPSNTDSQDSPNPLNPSNTYSKDSPNPLNPSPTYSQDSPNQVNPSPTDSQDSSDKDNHQHQNTVNSLILVTLHPDVSSLSNLDKTKEPYVKDGVDDTEPMSDIATTNSTSHLEKSKVDDASVDVDDVTLHECDSGTDTNNDKSVTNEYILSTIDSFNEETASMFAKLTTNNISLEKGKNPRTSELKKESKQSEIKDKSCLDKTKDISPQSEHTVGACVSSRQTKSFTLTDEHIRLLECLGFKEYCEEIIPGLTMRFNKEQNCIILESTVDLCRDVEIETLNFLGKCKKHSWELDCMQTILLTECTSVKAHLIEFFHKKHIYCCFDPLNKVISICAKSEDDLRKYEKCFCENVHCEIFYIDPHEDQNIESYLLQLQMGFKERFYFSRATDGKVKLVCLSSISKDVIEDIKLHFNLSEDDITHPEMLLVNMNQMQNNNDLSVDPTLGAHSTNFRTDTGSDNQKETDYSVDDKQKKSEGSSATESHLMLFHCTPDVSKKGILQATNQGCLVDGKSVCLTEILAKHESQSSSTQNAETNHSAQPLPASVTDGLKQNTMDSAVMLNKHLNVEKGMQNKDQHSQNDDHNKTVLPEPSMHAEQKTNTLQLTKLEAKLISHTEIQDALILVFYKRRQHVKFHEEFLEIEDGDLTIVKEVMASEIHTEWIAADKDEQAFDDPNFSPYLVKTYDPGLGQITIVFHRMIEKNVLPIINHLKLSRCCCIFPLCVTTYTRSYLTQIVEMIQSQFLFKVDVEVIYDVLYGSSYFNITTEKTKLEEVKSTVDHLLKTIQIKTEVLKPHDANRLLNSQGQQYLMQLEEEHKCQINVVSCDRHVFMRASCPSGHKLFLMEGTMATADCQILVLPLCDGQKQWPPQYKSILEKSFLTTDMGQYSGIRAPPSPCTLSLECNGEAKGQTVVVMYVPSRKDRNFKDTITKVCEIIMSEISGKSTIAMPLELSIDISYKEFLPIILQVIREHTLMNENKPFSVFFYAGVQTLQSLKDITKFVETLLDKEEKFPPWKTNILPLGPYHRVKIIEADLEKVKADVIVNSTDPGLLHISGAVSKALLKAAGQEMADQCKELYSEGIGNRIVVATDSFHLDGAKAIFHIVLPQEKWNHKTGREELRNRVKACLMEASIKKYESIAFPALGVGKLGYPPDIVAQTMFTAATDFFLMMPESTVVNVHFVCHPSDKNAEKAFKVEEQRQQKKLQRPEEEQNECKEYLLSVGDNKLLVIKSDAQKDPFLTDFIIIASASQTSTATDYQRSNSGKYKYVQNPAKDIQRVFKSCIDFKQCRSVGIILDTFDDKWYSEILNAVDREIAGKSNLQFILFVQDKQKLDELQKLTGGKCEPIKGMKNKKGNREKTEIKEGMIYICGPKDEIEQAMTQLKEMQCIPSYQRPVIPKDQSVFPQNVPLPKDSDDETRLENTQQLMCDFCKLIIPNRILKPHLHHFSSLTDVRVVPNPTGSVTEFYIKCDSIEKAKAGIQDIFRQISDVTEHSSSLTKSEESDSFMKEIDCQVYEALEYIFGDKFTSAFSIQSRDINKVTIQTPNIKIRQSLEEKIASLRQEDVPLSSHEMEVLGNSVDVKSENIDVFIKLMHDQNKAILFGCDYSAVTKAKHLILVKCGRTKLTNRAKRQFAAGSGDPICNQIPKQNTGATSPGIGYAKDFVTKSGIKISVYKADITQLTVDAIVNAANENLGHGGGVAFAIAKAAGPDLEVEGDEYIRKFGPLKVSEVVKTTAGRLPCKAVLHAVGPRWDDYQNKEECKQALQQTVYNCLRKSHDLNYTSLAVTSISSAIFGVPKAICADSYLAALQSFEQHYGKNTNLQNIHFVDISDEMICIIQDTFKEKWHTPVLPNYVQQSFGGGLKLKSGDGIASESSSVTLGKTEKEPAYQYNFSHLSIIVKQQHISETDADVIVLWQESDRPFEDSTSQQVLKATGKQLLAKEMAILKHKLVSGSGQIEMLTTSKDQLIVLPVMTSFIMNTNDVFALMEKVFNMIDIANGKSVAISSLPYLTRQKESNSSSKDLEEFTAGLCMAVLNYVKKSDGPVNCIYIYAENVEVFRVMVHVISVKVREYESSSRLLNEAGIKQSYSDPINKILPTCKICLDEIVNSKTLSCGHTFCEKCIDRWFNIQKVCPCCKSAQGLLTGNQPVDGKMEIKRQPFSLKGFDSKDCFKIVYSFPPGKQSEEHPNPGKHYSGTNRVAFIPNTEEGRKVLMLLKVAFDRRLVFTVGTSATSGCGDCIIWNGIHHKTNIEGGIQCFGYPDHTYLTRVQRELKDVGVTVKDLSEEQKYFIQHPRQVYK